MYSSPGDKGCSCNYHYTDVNVYHPPLDISEMPEGVEWVDWRWVPDKEHNVWQYLDEKGRPYLCCEFDSSEEGYDIEVKLFLTKEQSEAIKDIPQEHGWCKCDIYLKNGTILKDEWITNKEYLWVIEDLNITNQDIIKIIHN